MNANQYRIIFNQQRGQLMVVAETALGGGSGAGSACGERSSGALSAWSFAGMLSAVAAAVGMLFASSALANPVGGAVVAGNVSIANGGRLITQTSQNAIVNWQGFGVNAGNTVQFVQPNAAAAILNRVTGNLPTRIDGNLLANGRVFVVNPNGIVVGANGVVNVQGGFVGSTQNISDAAFMAGGALDFTGGNTGSIEVLGRIESANGSITLIAPKTSISAGAQLVAGQAVQLVAASQVRLSNGQITVTPQNGDAGELTVSGAVQAAKVQLEAVNNNLGALAINTTGTIRATGVQVGEDGTIRMVAQGAGGNITVGGMLEAKQGDGSGGSGGSISIKADAHAGTVMVTDAKLDVRSASGKGGQIDVTGYHTGLTGSTTLDASGATAGGRIRVGGGWQGKEADISNASATYVGKDVQLKADATGQGDGGRVGVWADGITRYNGALSARGAGTGSGGDAEVSGKQTLAFNGTADLRGGNAQAKVGTLLLDPSNITIQAAGPDASISADGSSPNNTFTSTSTGDSVLTTSTLSAALNTANVVVQTDGALNGTGGLGNGAQNDGVNGDIWVKDPLTSNGFTFLSLRAHDDVIIDAPITLVNGGFNINDANPANGTPTTGGRNVYINQPIFAQLGISAVAFGDLNVGADLTTGPNGSIRLGISTALNPSNAYLSSLGRINFSNDPVLTSGTGALWLGSGLPSVGASDLLSNVTFRYASPTNNFGDVHIEGFNNIDFKLLNNNGSDATRLSGAASAGGGVWFRSRANLTLPQNQIESGADGGVLLIGAEYTNAGRVNLLPNVQITSGLNTLYLSSGSGGGGAPDFSTAQLRYAHPSNTFGYFAIQGMDLIDLNLLDFNGVATNQLTSNSLVNLNGNNVHVQENIRTGANSDLNLISAANGHVEFGPNPQLFEVGAGLISGPLVQQGSIRIRSGDTDPADATQNRSDMTNVTLQYRDGNSSTHAFRAIELYRFNNLTLKLNDSTGALDQTLNATDYFQTFSSGITKLPQNLKSSIVSVNNDNIVQGQVVLRTAGDTAYTGPQIFEISSQLAMRSPTQLAAPTDFTNVIFGPAAGGNWTMDSVYLSGFGNVDMRLANPNATWTVNNFFGSEASSGAFTLQNNVNMSSTGYFSLSGSSINTGNKILSAPNGGSALVFSGTSAASSTLNVDAGTVTIAGPLTGALTLNEKNSIKLNALGDPNSTADLTVLAQGDITVAGPVTRVSTSPAKVTLQADANLSGIFGAGTGGADGAGATLISGPTVYSFPIFTVPYVYNGPTFNYSIDASGVVSTSATAPASFVSYGSNAQKAGLLASYGLASAPGSSGTLTTGAQGRRDINPQYGFVFPSTDLTTAFTSGGKTVYYVSGYTTTQSYGASPAVNLAWTSLGSGGTGVNTVTEAVSGQTLSRSGTWVGTPVLAAGDTAIVDVSAASAPGGTNYFGNPVTNGNTLNMSGQFYTLDVVGAPINFPTPATASLTPNSSTGWARVTQTVDVAMGTGNFVAAGASKDTLGNYANLALGANLDQGFGNPLNLASNVKVTSNGGSAIFSGFRDITLRDNAAINLGAGALSLQAGRDIVLNADPSGTSTTGTLALVAGGTVVTGPGVTLGGTGSTGAGSVLVQAGQGANLTTNLTAIEGGLGFLSGDGRYLGAGLTAGAGVDAVNYAAMLASGSRNADAAAAAASGQFKITETDQGNNGLTIGSPSASYKLWNSNTLASASVAPVGLSATLDANNTVSYTGNMVINQTNAAQNLTVAKAITLPNSALITTGEVNLKSAGGVVLNANITNAGAGRNVFIEAEGSLTQNATSRITAQGIALKASSIGSSGQRVQTAAQTLALQGLGGQYIQELDSVTLAAATTGGAASDSINVAAGGTLSTSTVTLAPTVAGNATGAAALYGVNAAGSGAVNLTALGVASDIALGATVRSGTGAVALNAGRNLTDTLAGDLASGAQTSASNLLNVATGGNLILSAAGSIGSSGAGAPDALEVFAGGTLTSSSAGNTGDAGTYLNVLANGANGPSLANLTSGKNLDVTSRASTTQAGNLVTDTAVTTQNAGYLRLAADGDITAQNALTAGTGGNLILSAGLDGAGSVNQTASGTLTASGTGEINVLATSDIFLGGSTNASATQGQVLMQAVGGLIVQTGSGSISANNAALTANSTIGTASNRVQTNVNNLVLSSAGDQYVQEANALSLAAATSAGGSVNVATTAGDLSVTSVGVASGLTASTGGVTATAASVPATPGIIASGAGNIVLAAGTTAASNSDLLINQALTSTSGEINLVADRSIAQAANISTAGNALLQAKAGAITQTLSTLSANRASLTAATTIGSAVNRLQTQVTDLALNSAGSQFATETGAGGNLNLAANSTGGSIDVATSNGTLSTGAVNFSSTSGGAAAGPNLTGVITNAGSITLNANGAASDLALGATVRSTSGAINLTAARAIGDTLAGDLSSGAQNASSNLLNVATTSGAISLNAVNIGAAGAAALDISTGSGSLTSTSTGAGATDGTYLVMLDSTGSTNLGGITSAKNLDITARASSTAGTGTLTTSGALQTQNGGYLRLAADQNLNLNNLASTTGGGEINLLAANNIALGANLATSGNAVLQATGGAITNNGASINAAQASLSAGTTIGSAANRIQTQVTQLALLSGGNQFVSQTNAGGALTLAARSTAGGSINVATTAGPLTVGSVNVVSTVPGGASPQNLAGVAASGAGSVNLSAAGVASNLTLNRDVSSATGNVNLTASQDIVFNANNAQVATTGTVTATASRDIVNATGQASGGASREQIVAAQANLRAGRNIGSGVIDNSLSGVSNSSDLNLNVASLNVQAGTSDASGSAVLWSQGAVQLVGANSAANAFGINAGGVISQAVGSVLTVGGDVEFDTMRNSAIGAVDLRNQGALTLGQASYAGGNYSATSDTGAVTLASGRILNVNGDAAFNGTPVILAGDVKSSGNVVQNGVITNTAGLTIATLQVTGNQAIVTAYGSTADFSLSAVLTPSVLASLGAGVDTVVVNLGNQSTTFSVAGSNISAVSVANSGNQVAGQWTVRTGSNALANPTTDIRNYNLSDAGAGNALDLGNRNLQVHAARGTAFAAGSQASSEQAVASVANGAVGFNAAQGSSVNLTQTRSSGLLDVRDAYDINVQTPTDLNVGYAHANRDMTLVANAQGLNNLSLQGQVFAGRHLIAVAGRDVTVSSTGNVQTVGRATFVADEAAGTQAGTGWFRNLGSIQSQSGNVAVYAVAGGQAPAGYIARPSQIVLGNIAGLTETQPIGHWNTYYQTHSGGSTQWAGFAADGGYKAGAGVYGSPQLWYKNISLVPAPVPVVFTPSYVPTVFQLEPGALSVVNENAPVSGSSAAGAYAGHYSDSAHMPVHFAVLGYLLNGDDGDTDSSGAYNFAPQSFHASRVPLCFNLPKDCAPESTTTITAKPAGMLSSSAPTQDSPVGIKPLAQP